MIGVDEVGRGSWAGPLLVVAARQKSALPSQVKDSKLLSKKLRAQLYSELISVCYFAEGWVSSTEIDTIGLSQAMILATNRALIGLQPKANEQIIIDGNINYAKRFPNSFAKINADESVPIVSAASILAKQIRDRFMQEISIKHPGYGFEKHVGYGTNAHRQALRHFGIVFGLHRESFAPIKSIIVELNS